MSSFRFRPGNYILLILAGLASFIVEAVPILNARAAGSSEFPGSSSNACKSPTWLRILIFYATNYLAHIATVRTVPGAKIEPTVNYMLLSLLLPYYGIGRGFEAISRHAIFKHSLFSKRVDSQLQMALQSGALCVVVRGSDWDPLPDNESELVVNNVRHLRRPIESRKEDSDATIEAAADIELQADPR